MRTRLLLTAVIATVLAPAIVRAADPTGTTSAFDACGTLVAGNGCVLFDGGGGRYVIADPGNWQFGRAVRVIGTLDTNCTTICDADGCVRGAELIDPAVYPCGTPLPDFPGDIVSGVCSSLATTLVAVALAGLWLTQRPRALRR